MRLSEEDIKEINKEAPNEWQENEQGIFTEPYGIPAHIKEPVIYMRFTTGGVSGGSCWDSSNPQSYTNDNQKPKFKVLDLVLSKLKPDITFLPFREIEDLLKTN